MIDYKNLNNYKKSLIILLISIIIINIFIFDGANFKSSFFILTVIFSCTSLLNQMSKDGDFIYGEYHVNVDGMFTYEGYKREQSGYGYGISEEEKYDFTYEASNGIKVYFVRHSNGQKLIFQAGNLLYQVNTDAPVKDLERLIETFEF